MKKKVIYTSFTHDRLTVVDYLYDNHGWEPVFFLGIDPTGNRAEQSYPNAVLQDNWKLRRGHFDYSKLGPVTPIDAEIIGSLSKYESSCFDLIEDTTGWNFSFYERQRYYYDLLKYWNTVIQTLKPDLLVCYVWPHVIVEYTLYLLCKHYYSIDVLFLDPIPHLEDDYHTIGCTTDELSAPFKDRYLKKTNDQHPVVEKYLRQLRSHKPPPPKALRDYYAIIKKREGFPWLEFFQLLNSMRRGTAFQDCNLAWKKNKHPFESKKSKLTYLGYFLFRERLRRQNKKLKKTYGKYTQKPDLDKTYLYFASQYQPEAVTSPHSGVYSDFFLVLDILSSSIPKDWVIYYKDHPSIFNVRDKGALRRNDYYYKKVSSYENLVMLPYDFNTFQLIDNAKAVSTVCGTAGWEAVVRGKPALVFGRCWYSSCKSVFMIKTLNEAKEAIRQIKDGYLPNQRDIENYVKSIYNSSYHRLLDSDDYRTKIVNCKDINYEMKRIAKAFYEKYAEYYGSDKINN